MGRARGGQSLGEARSPGGGSTLTESSPWARAPVRPVNRAFVKCPVCAEHRPVLANRSEHVAVASLPGLVGLKRKGTLAGVFPAGAWYREAWSRQAGLVSEASRGRCQEAP